VKSALLFPARNRVATQTRSQDPLETVKRKLSHPFTKLWLLTSHAISSFEITRISPFCKGRPEFKSPSS